LASDMKPIQSASSFSDDSIDEKESQEG